MNKKEFRLFMVLAFFILVASLSTQYWLFPAPTPTKTDKVVAVLTNPEQRFPLLGLTIWPAPVRPFAGDLPWPSKGLFAQAEAHGRAELKKPEKVIPPPPEIAAAPPAKPDRDFVLGGAGHKLTVVFSAQAAAVRSITLNDYQSASQKEGKKVLEPLLLVTDEDKQQPQSFRLLIPGASVRWEVHPDHRPTSEQVVFLGRVPEKRLAILKTFTLRPGQYHVEMSLEFRRTDGEKQPVEFAYHLTGPANLPIEGEIWQQGRPHRRVLVGAKSLQSSAAVIRLWHEARSIGAKAEERIAKAKQAGAERVELTSSDLILENFLFAEQKALQYAGLANQFFAALAVVHGNPAEHPYVDRVETDYSHHFPGGNKELLLLDKAKQFRDELGKSLGQDMLGQIRLVSRPIKVFSDPVKQQYLLYAGPAKVMLLGYEPGIQAGVADLYSNDLSLRTLTDSSDTNDPGFLRRNWTDLLVFFTNFMHHILEWFHKVGAPYWACIILLTISVRLCMFPVSRKQALSAQKMQSLQPELSKLKEKYKDDRQAFAQAQWELFRKHKVNPLSGCLVIFLQLPVMMGLYYALSESVHLRLAGFLWIDNLAVPDMLLNWGNWDRWVPFLNLGPFLNVLPIVAIALMFVQQKLLAPPALDDQTAMQMRIMNYMTIVFGYMFYWVASGLCLYFSISSAWGLVERKLLPKRKALPGTQGTPPLPPTTSVAAKRPPKPTGPAARSSHRDRPAKNGEPAGFLGKLSAWWNKLLEEAKKK